MSQNKPTGKNRRDEMILWKSLLAAGAITLIFYMFVLAYVK